MKKVLIVGLLGALLGVAAGTSAQAQTPDTSVVKPISIKIGAFFPTDSNLKNGTHNTWFKVGADYAFGKTTSTNPLLTSIYADYAGSSSGGNHANLYDVGVAGRYYFTTSATGAGAAGSGTSVNPYAGAGIGAYFENAQASGDSSKTTATLGGKIFLGAELNTGPFIEASYDIVPQKLSRYDLRYSGFDVSVGYRF